MSTDKTIPFFITIFLDNIRQPREEILRRTNISLKMVQIVGKYAHVRSEHLDDYFKAIGVPYIPRKMMCASNPTVEISNSEDGYWTITVTTTFRTTVYKFKLGEDYEETMPGNTLKCNTVLEDNKLITTCIGPKDLKTVRIYEFTDEGMTLTYKNEAAKNDAIRHYKRA